MVRDHRNSPLLLVRLNEPYTAANQDMYATTGSAPAASTAHARRQPARFASRYTASTAISGSAVGRTTAEAPISSPAAADRGTDGGSRSSSTASAAIISVRASRSAMISCSSRNWAGSNSTVAQASVAIQERTPARRSTAYIATATARPARCCRAAIRVSECSGRSSQSKIVYPPGLTGFGRRCAASHR